MGGLSHEQWEIHYRWVEVKALRAVLAANDCSQPQRVRYAARLRCLEKQRTAACADRRLRDSKREAAKVKVADEVRQAEIDRQHAIQQAQQSAETARQNAIAKKESDRLAAIAKVKQDRLDAMPKAWKIPSTVHNPITGRIDNGYDCYVDKFGKEISLWDRSKYHILGQTDLHRALQVQNSGGALVLSKRLEPYVLHT
jgi:hypothetical protein